MIPNKNYLKKLKNLCKINCGKAKDRKIATLEDTIKHKDEVITELAQELLELKKRTLAFIRMAHRIVYYNSVRLHSAIWYLTPDDVFNGRTGRRLVERKEKLYTAFIKRKAYWQSLNASA